MTTDDSNSNPTPDADEEWIDKLGKRAGGAMRKPAPESGFSNLQRRQRARNTKIAAATGGVVAMLVGLVAFAVTRGGNDGVCQSRTVDDVGSRSREGEHHRDGRAEKGANHVGLLLSKRI